MAARRLKFKPKPSVANSVRRGQDKEDFLGLKKVEQPVTDKELPLTIQEASSSECIEENQDLCPGTDSNEILSFKKLKKNHIVEVSDNLDGPETATTFPDPLMTESCKVNDFHNRLLIENSTTLNLEPHEKDRVPPNGVPLINPSFDKDSSIAIFQNKEICPSSSNHILNQKIENISNSSDTTCEKFSINTDQGSHKSVPGCENNTIESSNSSTKDLPCDKKTSKSDSTKIFSRFARCKPVLNNTSLRKKNEVSENLDSSISVNNLRTDSVIKSVQSELSKINSLSKENNKKCNSFELEKTVNPKLKEKNITALKTSVTSDEITVVERNQCVVQPIIDDFLQSPIVKKPKDVHIVNENKTLIEKPSFIDLSSKNVKIFKSNENSAELINSVTKSTTPSKVPVSPLRPTSKVLVPKPCPRLTDAASRRISFYSSDSEDEARKKFSNLKEKPNIPQIAKKEKTLKNSKRKRSQGATFSKLGQDTMKELTKKLNGCEGSLDKTKLTMLDLIFYNPKNNPMSVNPNQNSTARKKEEKIEVSQAVEDLLEEQSVDDVESTTGAMPVPQLKVGPDGQIMLDPHSLVIETTGVQKNREKLENSQVVQESGITRYSTYSKRKLKRCEWTPNETLQFYRALSTIGSDFSLMTQLFPKRTRHELKLKFKREERANMHLIDKAMKLRSDFEFQKLEEELKRENEEIERKKKEKELTKETVRKQRALNKEMMLRKTDTTAGNKKCAINRRIKLKNSAFKEFSQDEREQFYKGNPKRILGKKRRMRKKCKNVFDSDSDQDVSIKSDSPVGDNVRATRLKTDSKSMSHCNKNTEKPLKECEEINETLKKKLEHENASRMKMEEKLVKTSDCDPESEDDVYTPNNTNAFVLFGSPKNYPTEKPEEELPQVEDIEDSNWNIEIQRLPTIEETVMIDNVEEVSELSELGSFGQNDTALDLSIPVRSNITSEMFQNRQSLLNRHLISESIQIIDQLTSVESSCSSVFTEVKENIAHDLEDSLSIEELADKQIRLPSFESVNRSRPSMVYPLQVPYDPRNYENNVSEVVNQNHDQKSHENENMSNVFIANFYRETEECILGD